MTTPYNEINCLILLQAPPLGAPSLRRVPQSAFFIIQNQTTTTDSTLEYLQKYPSLT